MDISSLPYTSYRSFLARHFSGRVQKIPLHLGNTCPVRDGKLGWGGCAFCNGASFVPAYIKAGDSISVQLEKGISFFSRKYRKGEEVDYLAYFQSGTSTYCSPDEFCRKCMEALSVEGVSGLVVSTRPDCLGQIYLDFLQDLSKRCFVMVELGVESFDDQVLLSIARGHSVADSVNALKSLADRDIPSCVHLILGLPGERDGAPAAMARQLSSLPVDVVKLHQLQIVKGANLAKAYQEDSSAVQVYTLSGYVHDVADFLEWLPSDIAVERFVSQTPPGTLLAPFWGVKPDEVQRLVVDELLTRKSCQGIRLAKMTLSHGGGTFDCTIP